MMRVLGQIGVLISKDLRIEARGREAIGLVIVLGILIVVVLGMGLGASRGAGQQLTGFEATAILWVAYLFGGVLCFEKTMAVERSDDALAGLLTAPLDRGAIYAAKLVTNLVLMFLVAIVVTPVAILLFHFDLSAHPGSFILVISLGMIGYAAVGTLFAAAVSSTRLQGGLLAMLVFPLSLPVVIISTQLMRKVFEEGQPLGMNAVGALVAFDVIYIVVSWLVFESVLEP
jgi:heme exporter protein B